MGSQVEAVSCIFCPHIHYAPRCSQSGRIAALVGQRPARRALVASILAASTPLQVTCNGDRKITIHWRLTWADRRKASLNSPSTGLEDGSRSLGYDADYFVMSLARPCNALPSSKFPGNGDSSTAILSNKSVFVLFCFGIPDHVHSSRRAMTDAG